MSNSFPLPTKPEDVIPSLVERFNSKNLEAMLELYSPEAVFVAHDGRVITDRNEFGAQFQRDMNLGAPLKAKVRHVFVGGECNRAVVSTAWAHRDNFKFHQKIRPRPSAGSREQSGKAPAEHAAPDVIPDSAARRKRTNAVLDRRAQFQDCRRSQAWNLNTLKLVVTPTFNGSFVSWPFLEAMNPAINVLVVLDTGSGTGKLSDEAHLDVRRGEIVPEQEGAVFESSVDESQIESHFPIDTSGKRSRHFSKCCCNRFDDERCNGGPFRIVQPVDVIVIGVLGRVGTQAAIAMAPNYIVDDGPRFRNRPCALREDWRFSKRMDLPQRFRRHVVMVPFVKLDLVGKLKLLKQP